MSLTLTDAEWIERCAARLHEQWRHASHDDLLEAARELCVQDKWRRFAPEVAAVAWLRLGVLAG
jgi:hypothetical protein